MGMIYLRHGSTLFISAAAIPTAKRISGSEWDFCGTPTGPGCVKAAMRRAYEALQCEHCFVHPGPGLCGNCVGTPFGSSSVRHSQDNYRRRNGGQGGMD